MKRTWRGLAVAFTAALLLVTVTSAALPDTATTLPGADWAGAVAKLRSPIPQNPESMTLKRYYASDMKRLQRTMVEAYRKIGRHNPAWDDMALKFLEASALQAGSPGSADLAVLRETGRQLEALGCDDPVVLLIYAGLCRDAGNRLQARVLGRDCVQGFKDTAYLASMRWLGATGTLAVLKEGRPASSDILEEQRELEDLAIRWIAEAAGDGSYLDGEQMAFLAQVEYECKGVLKERFLEVYKAIIENPKADPYIKGVVGGKYHTRLAWVDRGGGLADSVKEEGWKGFDDNLSKARLLLTEAWKLKPGFPAAASAMIPVAMAGPDVEGETPRLWFDRAVTAEFDYLEAYDLLIQALVPRWGGSHEELYSFGLDCLETGRFDTQVPFKFFFILRKLETDFEPLEDIWLYPGTYKHLKTMFEGYDRTVTADSRLLMKSRNIGAAWRCREYAEARRLRDELGDKVVKMVFPWEFGKRFEQISQEIDEAPAGNKPPVAGP